MPTDAEKKDYINDMVKARGYAHRSHRLMANHDLDLLRSMNPVPTETYVVERALTFAEKELLLVPAFACLRSPAYIIKVHVTKAVSGGMPLRSILEAIELLAYEAGRTIFANALLAFQEAVESKAGPSIDNVEPNMDKPTMTTADAYTPPHELVLEKHDATVLRAVRNLNDVVHDKRTGAFSTVEGNAHDRHPHDPESARRQHQASHAGRARRGRERSRRSWRRWN